MISLKTSDKDIIFKKMIVINTLKNYNLIKKIMINSSFSNSLNF